MAYSNLLPVLPAAQNTHADVASRPTGVTAGYQSWNIADARTETYNGASWAFDLSTGSFTDPTALLTSFNINHATNLVQPYGPVLLAGDATNWPGGS